MVPMKPVLAAEHLSFSFGRTPAVTDVSLTLHRGEMFGFVGPNGAGKTTTIKMVLGLLEPDQGAISAFGFSMRHHRLEILRRIGALVETPALYQHLTAEENLRINQLVYGVPRRNIDQVLDLTGLLEARRKRVKHYSLGMKQRLGIAMALLHQPELLILDEPANGLDPAGIQELRVLLKQLAQERGLTILVSSHVLAELEQTAASVAIITRGRLRYHGSLDELKAGHRGVLHLGVSDKVRAGQVLLPHGYAVSPGPPGLLEVAVTGKGEIARINELMVRNGIDVYQLSFAQPNLEEIFLRLVREGGEGEAG